MAQQQQYGCFKLQGLFKYCLNEEIWLFSDAGEYSGGVMLRVESKLFVLHDGVCIGVNSCFYGLM